MILRNEWGSGNGRCSWFCGMNEVIYGSLSCFCLRIIFDLLYCYNLSLENFCECTFLIFFPPQAISYNAIANGSRRHAKNAPAPSVRADLCNTSGKWGNWGNQRSCPEWYTCCTLHRVPQWWGLHWSASINHFYGEVGFRSWTASPF